MCLQAEESCSLCPSHCLTSAPAVQILPLGKLGLQGQLCCLSHWTGWSLFQESSFLTYTPWIICIILFLSCWKRKQKGTGIQRWLRWDSYTRVKLQQLCSCGGEHEDCSLLLALPTVITPNWIMVTPCSVQRFGFPDSNTSQTDTWSVCIPPDVYSKTSRVQSPHGTAYANVVFNKWFGWAKVNRQCRHHGKQRSRFNWRSILCLHIILWGTH